MPCVLNYNFKHVAGWWWWSWWNLVGTTLETHIEMLDCYHILIKLLYYFEFPNVVLWFPWCTWQFFSWNEIGFELIIVANSVMKSRAILFVSLWCFRHRLGCDNTTSTDYKPTLSPMSTSQTLFLGGGLLLTDPIKYRQLVTALQYVTLSRLDITFVVNMAC